MNPDGSDRKQLTFSQEHESEPAWSPDGTKIAFASLHLTGNGGYSEIFVMNPDGSDQRRLTESKYDRSPTWSPDGTKIAFWSLDSSTRTRAARSLQQSAISWRLTYWLERRRGPKFCARWPRTWISSARSSTGRSC